MTGRKLGNNGVKNYHIVYDCSKLGVISNKLDEMTTRFNSFEDKVESIKNKVSFSTIAYRNANNDPSIVSITKKIAGLKEDVDISRKIYQYFMTHGDDAFRLFDQRNYNWVFGNTTLNNGGCSLASYANMLRYLYGAYFASDEAYAAAIYETCLTPKGNFNRDNVDLLKIIQALNKRLGLDDNVFFSDNGNGAGRGGVQGQQDAARRALDSLDDNDTAILFFKANNINDAMQRRDWMEQVIGNQDDVEVEFILRGGNNTTSAFSSQFGHYTTLRQTTVDGKTYFVVDDSVPRTQADYEQKFRENNPGKVPSSSIEYGTYTLDGKEYSRIMIDAGAMSDTKVAEFFGYGAFDCVITLQKKDPALAKVEGSTMEEMLESVWGGDKNGQ